MAISKDQRCFAYIRGSQSLVLVEDGVERVLAESDSYSPEWAQSLGALTFSPDGQRLTWYSGRTLSLLNLNDPSSRIRTYDLPALGGAFAWSPDSDSLFVGGHFSQIIRLHCNTFDSVSIHRIEPPVHVICVSRDGEQLFSGHADGSVHFCSLNSKKRTTLHLHDSEVVSIALSADERIGVSVDKRSNVAVWFAQKGERIGLLRQVEETSLGDASHPPSACFTPDRDQLRLACFDSDEVLRLLAWDLKPERPVAATSVLQP